jgi:hypothetical protein
MNHYLLFILLIFSTLFTHAQRPALTANDWVLTELSVNGTTTLPSSIANLNAQDVVLQFTDTGNDYSFDTFVCSSEAIAGAISYPFTGSTAQQFNFLSSAQTLGVCCNPQVDLTMPPDSDCLAILDFSADYFNFWNALVNEVYDYEIVSIANTTSLRVTKLNGDYALYGNAVASNQSLEAHLDVFLVHNPVRDQLILQGNNLSELHNLKLYDLGGRILLHLDSFEENIDVTFLKTGIYVLRINATINLKFIKK